MTEKSKKSKSEKRASVVFQTPERAVTEFIRAMNEWEVDAYKRYKKSVFDETDHAQILAAGEKVDAERNRIIARFCTYRKRHEAAFGYPPQYDPKREKITDNLHKTSKRVEVLTEYIYPEQYINQKRRYKLILTTEGWKIDARTIKSNGRWYNLI